MQFLALLTSLLFVSASLAYKSINPVLSDGKGPNPLHKIDRKPAAAREYSAAYPRTNAERLARGLPPLKARFKWNKPGRLSHGPSRVELARRHLPSTIPYPPVNRRGHITAFDAESGHKLGFVRASPNVFGEFGLTNDVNAALDVTFAITPQEMLLDILANNLPQESSKFPFFGGVVGFASTDANIGHGNYNYIFLAGTEQTPLNSPPVKGGNTFSAATAIARESESVLWSFDAATLEFKAQWTNKDTSKPDTVICYTQDVLLLTGDLGAFQKTFGPAQRITLKFSAL